MNKSESFSRVGLKITVHDNRVEVVDGMFPTAKTITIPIRTITGVEITRLTKELVIRTADGQEHKYAIGGFGKSRRCRDAILARL